MPVIPETIGPSTEAVNLVTWGTPAKQFAVWYTRDGEIRVGRVDRATQRWGVNHDWHQLGGTPRTVLNMPRTVDQHNIAAIAVDGLGRLHVWANMHSAPMRAVRSVDPHTADTWMSDSGWTSAVNDFPGTNADVTYPFPTHMPDGSLILYIRDSASGGGSGRADSHLWRRAPDGTTWTGPQLLFQGLEVPDAKGPGVPGDDITVDSEFNWNAYPSGPLLVESDRSPHPGRLHTCWVWRLFALDGERVNVLPSYAYSDDSGVTWSAADGTAASLPITPLNGHACRLPGHSRFVSIARDGGIVVATLDQVAVSAGITVGQSYRVQVPSDASFDGDFVMQVVGPGSGLTADQIAWAQGGATATVNLSGFIGIDDYLNSQSVAVDDAGMPHIIHSVTPTWWTRWTGHQWVRSQIPTSVNGVAWQGVSNSAFWLRGNLWLLKAAGAPISRKMTALAVNGLGVVTLSGPTWPFGGHESLVDPEAWRRFGSAEILGCDGDEPRVFTFGNGARANAA